MKMNLITKVPSGGLLALAGSGEYLAGMQTVDKLLLAHLKEPANVVCLPTGAGTEGEARLRYWMDLGEEYFRQLGVQRVDSLPVFDRTGAEDIQNVGKVEQANFVYISGGKPHYLMECFQDTPLVEAILGVLKRGGVVAGCSAGAMIFGERIPNRNLLGETRSGFALLPGCFIIPHFDEIPFVARFAIPGLTGKLQMVGIEGNTSLVCSAEGCFVAGTGGVTIQTGNEKRRFMAE
jgi:cyanophycinase